LRLPNPALHAVMFERPLADVRPTHEQRDAATGMAFGYSTPRWRAIGQGAIAGDDLEMSAYLIWTAVHGWSGIEGGLCEVRDHALRDLRPDCVLASLDVGECGLDRMCAQCSPALV
jgi:hypothetical protein